MHVEDKFIDGSFDLMDKNGILAAKLKIVLSGTSRSGDSVYFFSVYGITRKSQRKLAEIDLGMKIPHVYFPSVYSVTRKLR